jgi:hypothetical protein
MLPIPKGVTVSEWSEKWLVSVKSDFYSVIQDDPTSTRERNERFGSYLPTLSTIITLYRQKAREQRNDFYKNVPRPAKGEGTIKDWEEQRDAATAPYRYIYDYLVQLREDIQKRISVAQTDLNFAKQEIQTLGQSD